MTIHTHQTAPTQFVEAKGIRFAYRRFGTVGTGPRGGDRMASLTPEAQKIFGATYDPPDHLWLGGFFTPSEASQAAGRSYLKRFRLRREGRDPEVNEKVTITPGSYLSGM